MTAHPRYQYKPEDLFQMDSSGHRIRLHRRLAQTLSEATPKDGQDRLRRTGSSGSKPFLYPQGGTPPSLANRIEFQYSGEVTDPSHSSGEDVLVAHPYPELQRSRSCPSLGPTLDEGQPQDCGFQPALLGGAIQVANGVIRRRPKELGVSPLKVGISAEHKD